MDRTAPASSADPPRLQDSRPLEHLTPQERAAHPSNGNYRTRNAPIVDPSNDAVGTAELTPQERAVFHVLERNAGRVLSRYEIARSAGLGELSPRRCDSLIVGVRRVVGPDRIRTVRRRGWMLVD